MNKVLFVIFSIGFQLGVSQDKNSPKRTFYAYLSEISEIYDLEFAIDPTIANNVSFDYELIEGDKSAQIESLKETILSNELTYLIIGGNTILVRQSKNKKSKKHISISGKIVDSQSNEHLSFASVFVNGSSIGVTSDTDGKFKIDIPIQYIGKELIFQYLAYEDYILKIPEHTKSIDVELTTSPVEINTILIRQAPPDIKMDPIGQSLNINLISYERIQANSFFKGSRNELSDLSSVSQSAFRKGIFIRGLESNSILNMDNIPVYRYDLFYQFLPLYNTDYFDQMRVFKNTSPISRDHNAYGLIDLNNTAPKRKNLVLEANLFYASLAASIPLYRNKFTLQIGGRRSLSNLDNNPLLNKREQLSNRKVDNNDDLFAIASSPSVFFDDYNIRTCFQDEKHSFLFSYQFRSQDMSLSSISEIDQNERIVEENQSQIQRTENEGFSVSYTRQLHKNFSSTLSYHSTSSFLDTETGLNFQIKNNQGTPKIENTSSLFNSLISKESKWFNELKLNNQTYRFGVQLYQLEGELNVNNNGEETIKLQRETEYFSTFLEAEYHWTKSIITQISLNAYDQIKQDNNFLMTKILTAYKINNRLSIRSSHALQNQLYTEANFENTFGQNFNIHFVPTGPLIPVSEVSKWMLGFQYLQEKWKLNLESFLTSTDGVVNITDSNIGFRNNNNNELNYIFDNGDGQSYGFDLSLDYSNKSYRSLIEYTWSKANVNYKRLYQGLTLPSTLDRRHQISWLQKVNYKDFTFAITNTFLSGTPYVDFSSIENLRDRRDLESVDELVKRLPAYYSLDLDLSYQFDIGNIPSQVTFSLINASNRLNVNSIIQTGSESLNVLTSTENLSRQVNIGFKVRL